MKRGGGIAQWLEQSAHNRLVAGSNPAAPTNFLCQKVFKNLRKNLEKNIPLMYNNNHEAKGHTGFYNH